MDHFQPEEEIQTIPDEAIRLRILANSDAEEDQHVKRLVRDQVNLYISELVKDIDDIKEARKTIAAHLPELREIVKETLAKNDITDSFTVDYASDVTFPMKVYDNFVYPAGEYEAVLITIGAGKGANWWCVLFPPLCFLDFSNGTTVGDDLDTKENSGKDDMEVIEKDTEDNAKGYVNDKSNNKVAELSDVMEEGNSTEEKENSEEDVTYTFFLFEWLGWS